MNAHLDLFSGVGGFALAAGWAGFKTIAFCEIDEYAQRVLIKNFRAVMADADGARQPQPGRSIEEFGRRVGDGGEKETVADAQCERRLGNTASKSRSISETESPDRLTECSKDAAGELSRPRRSERPEAREEITNGSPRIYPDIRQLDGTQFRGVDLLTAGVPCQPASCAGKRRGKADDRWLWPEAFRILCEAAPACAVFENPPGILSLESGVEFEHLLSEMESYGYSVQPIIVPACAVDARHRRDRVWVVANRSRDESRWQNERTVRERVGASSESTTVANSERRGSGARLRQAGSQRNRNQPANGSDVADARRELLQWWGGEPAQISTERQLESGVRILADGLPAGLVGPARWPDEDPQVPRTAKGVKDRVAKLRCLGNSIVPQVAYEILKQIANSRYEPARTISGHSED